MLRYIGKRLLQMIPVVFGVVILVFTIMHFTPGDPARSILGEYAPQEAVDALHAEMGLDDPFLVQLGRYLYDMIFHFDLGDSYQTGRPVSSEILDRFPTTLQLAGISCIIMIVVGVILGIISAVRQYSLLDNICTVGGLLGVSTPNFWLAMMLSMLFALKLKWLPATGWYGPAYWILPSAAVGISNAATIMRVTRSSMLNVIRQDYIQTARAKGQSEMVVIFGHALKNASIPIITQVGISMGFLLTGSMVIEVVFAIPGLGRYVVEAIQNRDYIVVQGAVMFISVIMSLVNLVVDLIYAMVDPRVRVQYRKKKHKREEE